MRPIKGMAILETCCFWKNVRTGSIATGIYTLCYFGLSTLMLLFYVNEEKEFLFGEGKSPLGESIIEKGDITRATVIFNISFLACSMLMIFASIFLLIGLRHNKRQFLLPWVFLMLCDLLLELAHLVHLSVARRVVFDPIVGFIFTIDFFILCLNLYCLLCVISQYQEYREQRSTDRPALSSIVSFTTRNQKHKKSPNSSVKHKQRRLLAASPLATSQRLTNFSTITEEEEQSKQKPLQFAPDTANGGIEQQNICEKITENSNSTETSEQLKRIPIIILDSNNTHNADDGDGDDGDGDDA